MPNDVFVYRVPRENLASVQSLLAHGVGSLKCPVQHKDSLNWLECTVSREAISEIEQLGGERITPR